MSRPQLISRSPLKLWQRPSKFSRIITRAPSYRSLHEGAFVQISAQTKAKQPEFGSAKSDTASTIISVLEMSEEDFTKLLAESEAEEDAAASAYVKLTAENKVA